MCWTWCNTWHPGYTGLVPCQSTVTCWGASYQDAVVVAVGSGAESVTKNSVQPKRSVSVSSVKSQHNWLDQMPCEPWSSTSGCCLDTKKNKKTKKPHTHRKMCCMFALYWLTTEKEINSNEIKKMKYKSGKVNLFHSALSLFQLSVLLFCLKLKLRQTRWWGQSTKWCRAGTLTIITACLPQRPWWIAGIALRTI